MEIENEFQLKGHFWNILSIKNIQLKKNQDIDYKNGIFKCPLGLHDNIVEDVEDYDVDNRNNVVNKCCKQSKT